MKMYTVFVGRCVDSLPDWSLRIEESLLVLAANKIVHRARAEELERVLGEYGVRREDVVELPDHQFIMPGLIDTHIHASQFPNAGIALELPLLEWLEKYTFPTEARFSKQDFSSEVYERCVRTTLDSGTTTAVYFATIHRDSSELLAKICNRVGQRAFVGKVCMDRNSPDYYVESTEESLDQTKQFVNKIAEMGGNLTRPIITPRFAPSCSRALMTELGDLAKEKNLHVQTHISENKKEVEWVKELEPDCDSYTQVYDKCGLLGPKTILAHGIHLTDPELDLIRSTSAGVSHCPNSNFSLKSGVCDVKRLRDKNVKVGLGTDCSGGYSPSMLNAMRHAITASNTSHIMKKEQTEHLNSVVEDPLEAADSVYLATRGGAALLDLEDQLGSLDAGKLADFIIVDLHGHQNTVPFGHESPVDLVNKFVFLGDDRNIAQVYVDGRKVKDTRVGQRG